VSCDAPNDLLYRFEGQFLQQKFSTQRANQHGLADTISEPVDLSYDQFLLRGSVLRNTNWVIGIVVYTGHDTKIIKNSKLTRQKYSEVERLLSWLLFGLVFLLFLLCICQAILGESWSIQQLGKSEYLMLAEETIVEMQTKEEYNMQMLVLGLTRAGRWLLILSNFVPISLIVTVESVRFLQAYFIQWDVDMFDKERGI